MFADADLAQAARGVAAGFLGNAGQACVSTTRIFVQDTVRDEFVELLEQAMTTVFTPADPLSPGTAVGPLSTKAQFDRVSSYLDLAVLDHVHPGMRVVREEIFGPVGALMTFTDVDDAITKANDTEYGLAASIWTSSLTTAHRMAAAVQAGTVWVNTWGEMSTGSLPFGGYQQSGLGREGGLEVLDASASGCGRAGHHGPHALAHRASRHAPPPGQLVHDDHSPASHGVG